MEYPSIIQIDDVLVSGDIFTEFFACDYAKCKGCCCIIGDSGAPLEECEIEALEKNYPIYNSMMRPEGKAVIEDKGFFEVDMDGDIVTPLVGNSEECAYCHFDKDGNCMCSIEYCWDRGKGDFKKPISCSLYPIRLSTLSNGLTAMNLHRWDICKDAFVKGRKDGIRVYRFLKDPITRYFGEEFYSSLEEAAKQVFGING